MNGRLVSKIETESVNRKPDRGLRRSGMELGENEERRRTSGRRDQRGSEAEKDLARKRDDCLLEVNLVLAQLGEIEKSRAEQA